ncbi:hypothetical protein [Blastococcus atacamensis]|uniref:hypothetical protein n=1 Tax=Blastococcus atacamensis TaxID=2070508 RepID=UPI000CEC2B6A|nr:hypothetical protein [Blastococcus atacamensis]
MGESMGVQAGRVCPGCGEENSIPLIYGMPGAEDFQQAERGVVALGGCLMPEDVAAFVCRSCDLSWGSEADPTADEAELAGLLGVEHADVVRALGSGWRREPGTTGEDGVAWFVSGEPAQVAIGIQAPWFVLDRPAAAWGEVRQGPLMGEGHRFTRDDVLHLPDVVADAAEVIASRRRRSFRWCRTCRRVAPPETFSASAGACEQCQRAAEERAPW